MIKVSAAVIAINNNYLISTRHPGSHLEGLWEFPGGKINDRETEFECLIRELKEELDVEIIPLDLIYDIKFKYSEKHVNVKFYRALPLDIKNFNPKPCEKQKIAWCNAFNYRNYKFVEADIPLIHYLFNYYIET